MKPIYISFLICFLTTIAVFGQNQKYTISGQLTDAVNGEDLPFATILINNLPGIGTTSNAYGFYSISLEEGEYSVSYQFMGYTKVVKKVTLDKNVRINVELTEESTAIEEVVISAEQNNRNITNIEVGVTKLDIKNIKELPTFAGEHDIIKVIQTHPGIKASGEGNTGYYVRGGGIDQNLILLDEAPVYNPSHLLGFFSVFNSDAIKSATMYKGGMMPEYGGRTASVLDIRMKDGNNKKYSVSGGIGIIASRLTLEGPIVKDKGSFIISGRRTYGDLFMKLSKDEEKRNTLLYFYDLNLKANYKITDKDRIYLSGYFGRDKFGFSDQFGIDWGNATGTFRWNHLFSDRLFSNTSIIYSDYDYKFGFGLDEDNISLQSVIKDFNIKQDFSFFQNNKNSFKFGFNVIYHTIEPGNLTAGSNTGITPKEAEPKYGWESALYIQNKLKVNPHLGFNFGLRYSFFNQVGPSTAYTFDNNGKYLSEEQFDKGENIQSYGVLEPRLSANFIINESSSIKAGYNRNSQYLHLLSNSTSSTPTDSWIMSSNNVKPQIADQVSAGYFRNFSNNNYETSVEAYYKDMQNVIDYRNGANVFLNEQLEGDLVYGDGKAYGLEFFVKKNKGRLTGWFSYTLSRTLRKFDEINEGKWFSAKQDRIHDFSLVSMYKLSKKLTLSANFVYYTGDAITFPTGRYVVDGKVIPNYTERNGYRMPDVHRLDLGFNWQIKKTKRFESSLNFSLYNAYGRENAYVINFRPNEENPSETEAVQISLFKWIPSFTYNFRF